MAKQPRITKPELSLAHAPARRDASPIIELLLERDANVKVVDGLMEGLSAMRSFATGEGGSQTEPDYATRLKTQQTILAQLYGEPPKRTLVLHGEMPKNAPSREEMRDTIDKALAAIISNPHATTSELLAVKKTLAESEAATPSKLTPEEKDSEVRRILGIE